MITLTENAKEYLTDMVSKSEDNYAKLSVKGGGCAGFQYVWGLTSDESLSNVKWSTPIEDVLVLDPLAEMYVIGSTVDYITEPGGSFLALKNPQSTSICGCGESFGI